MPDAPVDGKHRTTAAHLDGSPTYRIIRYYQDDDRASEPQARGLTLAQAQAHCQRDDTHGEDENGLGWFDGYTEER